MNKTVTVDYDEYEALKNKVRTQEEFIEGLDSYKGSILRFINNGPYIGAEAPERYIYWGHDEVITKSIEDANKSIEDAVVLRNRISWLLSRNLWQRIINRQ